MDYKKLLRELLNRKLSDEIREEINTSFENGINEEEAKTLYKKIAPRKRFIVPREELAWNPTIDEEKCINCNICYNFCPKSVYEKGENTPVVANPTKCVYLCTGCVKHCPEGAISFPDKEEYVKFIEYI